MWRPKLAVRYGKHGGIASPTTTLGVVAYTLLLRRLRNDRRARADGAEVAGAGGGFAIAFAVIFIGQALRDAWAWFAATAAEREEFRHSVANVRVDRALRRPAGSGQTRSDWSNGLVLALAAVTVACFALIGVRADFMVAAMFSLAFLAVVLLDRFREASRGRR